MPMKTEPSKKKDARRSALAMLHIAKKELGLDDVTYRAILSQVAGVRSAADLDKAGIIRVISYLESKGFKPVHRSAKASGMHVSPSPDRSPVLSKIGAILAELGLPWGYADGMAKKMFHIDKVRWLQPDQLRKVMVALIYYQKRKRISNIEASCEAVSEAL